MKLSWLAFVFFVFPQLSEAAVSISEVAWMGSEQSANHEWIELHNDGSAEDVTGWKLTDGMNLEIELVGVLSGNSYSLLERTSDESAKGTAFLIYTGALVNTGATLKLSRADGSLVDQVNGGEDWGSIGGDNTTKETAQYTNSGWVTAEATPGKELIWSEVVEVEAAKQTTSVGSKSVKSKKTETVVLTLPDVSLELDVTAQEVGYVNQPIDFSVEASGIGDTLLDSLQYEWNFGDGNISNKSSPEQVFKYPGTFVVTVYAVFKRQEQIARHEITILPVVVSLTSNQAGDIQVNNDSPYEIDISGYKLRAEELFIFPDRSVILPSQTITIAKSKLRATQGRLIGFYDNKGLLLDSILPTLLAYVGEVSTDIDSYPNPQVSSIAVSRPRALAVESKTTDFGFVSAEEKTEEMLEPVLVEEPATLSLGNDQLAGVAAALPTNNKNWPYLALFGVLLLSTIGIYAKPLSKQNV